MEAAESPMTMAARVSRGRKRAKFLSFWIYSPSFHDFAWFSDSLRFVGETCNIKVVKLT